MESINQDTKNKLKNFILRIEKLEEEKKNISDDIKDVYSEAKAYGFDAKILKQIVKIRKMSPEDVISQEELLDTYKIALDMK